MSLLRKKSTPKDRKDPEIPREACSFVRFNYDAKNGRGVFVARDPAYVEELNKLMLEVVVTNLLTVKEMTFRGWSLNEETASIQVEDQDLVLFRVDY